MLLSSPFQIKVNFAFDLEFKLPESRERAENPNCLKSSVSIACDDLRICDLLVLVHCVLLSPKSI